MPADLASQASARQAPEQRAGGAARMDRVEEPVMPSSAQQQEMPLAPVQAAPQEAPVIQPREAASAPEFQEAPRMVMPPPVVRREPRPEVREEQGKGFLQRVADVGRAFTSRPEGGERAQVVARHSQIEVTERKPAVSEEEQYLDIPAFLRRQAN
jgi:hypothetical protein